ncbi:MAG: tRNA guanosine(34) transglycosylase Tgt [Clostridia bacterium]|nr:tRNA guanosine(34) transglycosylase Tgt [Clostridia bacterium]
MFRLLTTRGEARRGEMKTAHGAVQTPLFMNVATAGAVRGAVSADDLKDVGCPVCLCNTYHLHLRPGEDTISALGGLHRFIHWEGPILTDSGGFQVFSLAKGKRVREEGVTFTSYLDGKTVFFGPEESMEIQAALGSDIAMAFDECVALPADGAALRRSADRTTRWLERCVSARDKLLSEGACANPGQKLFGICQGGTDLSLRKKHMRAIASLDLAGYAVGGLSVGESAREMYAVLEAVAPEMPREKPRYLMGVGTPLNVLEGVYRGIDLFDCVLPGRNAYRGNVFTYGGRLRLLAEKYRLDGRPIEEGCSCPACRSFSRGYIRHLLKSGERLGMRLCVLHNLYFYNDLMARIRAALDQGSFEAFYGEYRARLGEVAKD